MMGNKRSRLLSPGELGIENVPRLFRETGHWQRDDEIRIDFRGVKKFDSSGIAFLNYLEKNYDNVSFENVGPDLGRALEMLRPGDDTGTDPGAGKPNTVSAGDLLRRLGEKYLSFKEHLKKYVLLLSDEIYYSIQYLFKRRGVYPGEIYNQLFSMGYGSFPIVCLISFLVGVTIAITSAEQLKIFGAEIYLADVVGFGMTRELVPLMTGIILAGKIGASITAEISSMKVLEEVDALKTMGLVPERFLMVPRLIAITLAVPLLVAVADFVGILGGVLVARFFSGILPSVFFDRMLYTVDLGDFLIGLGKTLVFGWVVVVSAGYKGFSVERGAEGVGIATTQSVVLSITLIIALDCVFALLLY